MHTLSSSSLRGQQLAARHLIIHDLGQKLA